jgi:hypothetical protein
MRLTGDTLPVPDRRLRKGIAVKDPGTIAQNVIAALVADVLLVSEANIESAIVKLLEIEKTVAEGAGAAGLAAVLANPDLFKGRKTGIVISGGNIDMRLLSQCDLAGACARRTHPFVGHCIEDRPGLLARIASVIGDSGRQYPRSLPQPADDRRFRQIGGSGRRDRSPRCDPCRRNRGPPWWPRNLLSGMRGRIRFSAATQPRRARSRWRFKTNPDLRQGTVDRHAELSRRVHRNFQK